MAGLALAACTDIPNFYLAGYPVAAFDTVTDELYRGTFRIIVGEPTGDMVLTGLASGTECEGVSGVPDVDMLEVGAIANLLMRCSDGRLIRGQLVYGSSRAGFGSAEDTDDSPYLILFGKIPT